MFGAGTLLVLGTHATAAGSAHVVATQSPLSRRPKSRNVSMTFDLYPVPVSCLGNGGRPERIV